MPRTQTTGGQILDGTVASADLVPNIVLPGTGANGMAVGTAAQRPAAAAGLFRYSSDLNTVELSINGVWIPWTPGVTSAALQVTRTTTDTLTTTATDITFDTVVSATDTSTLTRDGTTTSKLTAVKAGTYLFVLNAAITDSSLGILNTLRFKLNGVAITGGTAAGMAARAAQQFNVGAAVVVTMNAGDYVSVDGARGAGSGVVVAITVAAHKLDAVQGAPGPIGGNSSYKYYAAAFDNPNNADWPSNALAPAMADPAHLALTVRAFDDTAEEGVGFSLTIPPTATTLTIGFKVRAATAPTAAKGATMKLYGRQITNAAAIGAWGSVNLTSLAIPADAFFHYFTQQFALSALGAVAGSLYQFEVTRLGSDAGDTLVGDLYLIELEIAYS